MTAEVEIRIEKRLPVQGGLGAGSANAVAALVGLERELGLDTSVRGLPPFEQRTLEGWGTQIEMAGAGLVAAIAATATLSQAGLFAAAVDLLE